MIWTQDQAQLISDIYTLLDGSQDVTASKKTQSAQSEPSPPRGTSAVQAVLQPQTQPHARNISNDSSSSEEFMRSPNTLPDNSVLLKSLATVQEFNNVAFLRDYARTGSTGLPTSKGSLSRSGATTARNSVVFIPNTRMASAPTRSISPATVPRVGAPVKRVHPPSLLARSGGNLNGDLF